MNEPSWLIEYRQNAKRFFDSLPLEKSQYTQLKIDFDSILNNKPERRAEVPKHVKKLTEDKSKTVICQVDDEIVYTNVPENLIKKGLILSGLLFAINDYSGLLKEFFEKRSIQPSESKLAAFNFVNFSSGIFLYVPKGVELDEPVHYVFVSSAGATTISQTVIIAGEDSRFTFAEQSYSELGKDSFHSRVVEACLKENAQVSYASVQNFADNVLSTTTKRAVVGRGGKINWIVGRLGAKLNKAVRDTILIGEGAEVDDIEVFFGSGRQHYDITTNVKHAVPHTRGNILVKGVLKDKARSVSQGTVKVAKNAQKTDSFLAEHTLMLDKGARSDAIPGLEIETNDVRATHSASTSQIDKEQIFYLMSRGIEENEAKKLIVLGFLEAALQKISIPDIEEQFKLLIEEKWGK